MSSRIFFFLTLFLGSFKLIASISLSGNYTPTYIQCLFNVTFVRPASEGLSDDEWEWRAKRTPAVVDGLHSYLKNIHITDFDIDVYINVLGANESAVPVIGFTLSGGGTRAEMSVFGIIRAFDNRTADSVNAGTGGLLQTATYVSGLSGGGSALGLVAMSNFQPLDTSLRQGLVNYTALPSTLPIINETASKAEVGFKISISDIIAVGNNHQSLQIVNSSVDQYSRLWSDIQSFPGFSSGLTPMAILMLNEVIPVGLPGSASYNGTLESKFNGMVYEANFGSWKGCANVFTPIQYIGAQYQNGQPINNTCVNGFNTAAFILGLAELQTNGVVGQFARRNKIPYPPNEDVLKQENQEAQLIGFVEELPGFLEILGLLANTTSSILYAYWPNPFTQYEHSEAGLQSQTDLLLVDGSEFWGENPLPCLLQKVQGLDFIVVNDAGGSELSFVSLAFNFGSSCPSSRSPHIWPFDFFGVFRISMTGILPNAGIAGPLLDDYDFDAHIKLPPALAPTGQTLRTRNVHNCAAEKFNKDSVNMTLDCRDNTPCTATQDVGPHLKSLYSILQDKFEELVFSEPYCTEVGPLPLFLRKKVIRARMSNTEKSEKEKAGKEKAGKSI
ncbi:FabD/lysophospholipase-like protein [Gymnopus androsaceus JB14]|uniref:Lysophospholipase n=1 Tax=Gymnopus androsaceus JB14 TaxID=1447944 RepID=A0A6A4GEQ6_9AGAR|nr:FabD/lysophospholipase-like protein [Gymnopus androsaceus JB14]